MKKDVVAVATMLGRYRNIQIMGQFECFDRMKYWTKNKAYVFSNKMEIKESNNWLLVGKEFTKLMSFISFTFLDLFIESKVIDLMLLCCYHVYTF